MKIHRVLLLMLTALIFNYPAYGQFTSWFKIGDMPYPVAGARAVVIDNAIYVLGGYSDSLQNNVDFIQIYYPESGTWELAGHLPEPRYGFTAGIIDNKIVICGGISDPEKERSSLQIITKDSTGFNFYSDTTFKYNRIFSAGLIENRNLYLFGGLSATGILDTSAKAYIIRYDFATENTVFKDEKIYANSELPIQQMSAPLNNKVYLFGGVHNGILKHIYRFDPDSNRYSKLNTTLLEPRAGGEAVAFPETRQIMVIGGYNENSDALFSVEMLTFYSDFIMVEQQEPLIEPRKEFMAVNYGNFTFVMGGRDSDNKVISSIEIMEHYSATSVNDDNLIKDFLLYQNYPNPFNPGTEISFNIPTAGKVKLNIYSIMGELVKQFDETELDEGINRIYWNGTDNKGNTVAAGVYLSLLEYNNRVLSGKMLLVK